MTPRNRLQGTRADGQLLPAFWQAAVAARSSGGHEEIFGDARSVFTETTLLRLQDHCTDQALSVPILFTERLSNRVLSVCIGFRDGTQVVAVNARFKSDPELIAHMLVEEFVHAQQRLDGVDFDEQRRKYSYEDRPYEQEAKQIATDTLGYSPEGYDVILSRDEPSDVLDG